MNTEKVIIPCFKVGGTRPLGVRFLRVQAHYLNDIYTTVTAIVPGKVTRYRLEGRAFLYFENDLERVPA